MNVALAGNSGAEASAMRGRLAAMIEAGLALSRVAVETGVKRQDLQSWLDSRPGADRAEKRVSIWFEEIDRGEPDESEPGWVETPTSTKIIGALEFARTTPTIAIIYGGAGVSKTTTAKRFADAQRPDEESRIYFATASKWARSSTAILQEIAAAIDPYLAARSYRNDSLARGILRKLGPGDLLVIDEGQHLDSDALDGIRFFHDEAEIGIAYLGNLEVWSRISGKGRRAAFAQLHSRVGMRLQILAPQQGDVDAVLESWGIVGRNERRYAQQIASMPGGLRTLAQVLRQSRAFARGMKRPVDQNIMRAAAGSLGIDE